MRKIIFWIAVLGLVVVIYGLRKTKHITLYIGDTFLADNFDYSYVDDHDYRIPDMLYDIQNNIEIDGKKIQYLLVKCDEVYIKIGENDLSSMKLNYQNIDNFLDNLETLLELIRKYNKEKIYFININFEDPMQEYIIIQLKNLMSKYKIEYEFTN